MISKKDIQHIAKLARLGLSEKQAEKMKTDISAILGYVDKLKQADISKVEPTTHSVDIKNVMRGDSSGEKFENEKLLELAPTTKNRYLKVKSIL